MDKSLLLSVGLGLSLVAVPSAHADDLSPAIVTGFTGTLAVFQNIPCGNTVQTGTTISGGQFLLTPATGLDVPGGKQFTIAAATLAFVPFTAEGHCGPFSGSQAYSEIEVRTVKAVTVFAPLVDGVYNLTIPKSAVQFYEAAIVNGGPENGNLSPAQDVTGTIDLVHNTLSLHVVINTSVHFQEGCTLFGCIIDEIDGGTLTTDASGNILLPDTDGDGVPDILDNCRLTPNPTQAPVPTPTISVPPNLTLPTCTNTHQFGVAFAADVCDNGPVTVTSDAPATFVNGPNTVLWSATDQKLRVTTGTQIVTVVDTTPPTFTFVPAGFTMNTCGAFPLGMATATDDCAGTVTITNNSPGYFLVGATPVTWTATDASNNQSTATQTVTVIDTTPPLVSCTPVTPPGVSPQGNTFQVAASDACGAPTTQLGGFVLGNNEIVKIVETGQSGVRFVGTIGTTHIRYFQVGKGEAILVTTDGSGNTSTAVCK